MRDNRHRGLLYMLVFCLVLQGAMGAVSARTISENEVQVSENSISEDSIEADQTGKTKRELSGVTYDSTVPVWDCIYFGHYWQNDTNGDGQADTFDEQEMIKWRVLSVSKGKALLMADQILDVFPYEYQILDYMTDPDDITWETSGVNKYLQKIWIDNAFSSVEKQAIVDVSGQSSVKIALPDRTIINNSTYGFSVNGYKQATNTEYAAQLGKRYDSSYAGKGETASYWTSEVSNSYPGYAAAVNKYGSIINCDQKTSYIGIRPVITIDITKTGCWQYAGTVEGYGNATEYHEMAFLTESRDSSMEPVSKLVQNKEYYACVAIDEELAHGATFILEYKKAGGNTETYTTSKTVNAIKVGNSIYSSFPVSFSDVGNYTYKIKVKLADKSEITRDEYADQFQVVTADYDTVVGARWKYAPAQKTLYITGNLTGSASQCRSCILMHMRDIETLVVQEGVTSIPASLFGYRFLALKKVILPGTLKTIPMMIFRATSVEEISFGEGLEVIEEESFAHCLNLKKIVLPRTIKQIKTGAFRECNALKEIVLMGAQKISGAAFKACGIQEITLPANLESICWEETPDAFTVYGGTPFSGCKDLKAIYVDPQNPYYTSVDGILYTKDQTKLVLYPPAKGGTYAVPAKVTEIGYQAFYKCENLTAVTLPSGLHKFNLEAIRGSGIKRLVFPVNMKTLTCQTMPLLDKEQIAYNSLLSKDSKIEEMYISPKTEITFLDRKIHLQNSTNAVLADLSGIKVYGYRNSEAEEMAADLGMTFVSQGICHKVAFDCIPNTCVVAEGKKYGFFDTLPVPQKEGYLFKGWQKNKQGGDIVTNDSIVTDQADQILYAKWEEIITPLEKGSKVTDTTTNGKYIITKSDKNNPEAQYVGPKKNKSKITIPAYMSYKGVKYKITSMSANSFKRNRKVTNVVLSDSITKIGNNAFYGCSNLKSITIGKNVKSIGKNVFKDCKKLKTIKIKGSKLKTVGKNSLKGIHAKCKIKVPAKKVKTYKKLFKGKGQKKTVKITK